MKRLLLLLSMLAAAGIARLAQAGTVSYQFINQTSLSFDYSLQLANVSDIFSSNRSYLGKNTPAELTRIPVFGPGQMSDMRSYEVASTPYRDGVSFNFMTEDGARYGLRPAFFFHTCNISRSTSGVNVQFVLVDRGSREEPKLVLIEYTPDGDTCEYRVTEGFGPVLWGGTEP